MDWRIETGKYLNRWEELIRALSQDISSLSQLPRGPLEQQITPLQGILHKASTFLTLGAWLRTRELTNAAVSLWKDGHLSSVTPLIRLELEIWAVTHSLVVALTKYKEGNNLENLGKTVNRIFEGVKSPVLMPYGAPASEVPLHVLDAIRSLRTVYPTAVETYEYLCEATHPNFPRYLEWWLVGKNGDNWENATVQQRGHELLEKTVSAMEYSINGVASAVKSGLGLCNTLYVED